MEHGIGLNAAHSGQRHGSCVPFILAQPKPSPFPPQLQWLTDRKLFTKEQYTGSRHLLSGACGMRNVDPHQPIHKPRLGLPKPEAKASHLCFCLPGSRCSRYCPLIFKMPKSCHSQATPSTTGMFFRENGYEAWPSQQASTVGHRHLLC